MRPANYLIDNKGEVFLEAEGTRASRIAEIVRRMTDRIEKVYNGVALAPDLLGLLLGKAPPYRWKGGRYEDLATNAKPALPAEDRAHDGFFFCT